ncbi:MAG: prephenate dehydrogenase/arogenate dehydrogenase family protein [Candidatus Zixiibacteriota bacterium]
MNPAPTHRVTPRPRVLAGCCVGIVGLGQIGGSMARRLSRFRPSLILYGTDTRHAVARSASRFCAWRGSLARLVEQSDLVVLSVPVPEILRLLPQLTLLAARRSRRRRLLVVDTGTVKAAIMRAAQRQAHVFDFVGMHPLAGTERRRWAASDAGLFLGRPIVYCPCRSARATARARELIGLLGGRPVRMDAATHDRLVATTIGLPHILAYAAGGLALSGRKSNPLRGGSWSSLTRVAASDPAMVAGFLAYNAGMQRAVLARLLRRARTMDEALARSPADVESVLRRWTATSKHTHRATHRD